MGRHVHKEYRTTFTFEGKRYEVESDTQVGLEVALQRKREALEAGIKRISRAMTVRAWSDEYLESYRRDFVSVAQYTNLKSLMKHINSELGTMKISTVKRVHCMRVLSAMSAARMSKEYLTKTRGLMIAMFEEAIENELLFMNPARRLRLPIGTKEKTPRRAATDSEVEMLLAAGARMGGAAGAYIKLMLYFGLRPSEAARVCGCHFDLKTMRLRVEGTKSEKATRDVPIPEHLAGWVRGHLKNPFALLVTNHYGDPISQGARLRLWRSIKRDVDITAGCNVYRNKIQAPYAFPADLTAYCLRHRYASDMISRGIPKEIVSLLMGHADVDTTDIYISMTEEMFRTALERINNGVAARVGDNARGLEK